MELERPCASWAVVNGDGKLIQSSIIEGRVTSQRGECFGILVGRAMGPNKLLVADPLSIINTINRIKSGEVREFQWSKINNRSLLRNICFLTNHIDGGLKWVKSHQEGILTEEGLGNFAADVNAKKAANKGGLPVIGECWEFTDDYAFLWKEDLFEGSIRNKVLSAIIKKDTYKLCSAKGRARFRHESWWMELPDAGAQFKFGHLRFKLFTRSLPTYHILAKRFRHLYEKRLCPSCNTAVETDLHVFSECPTYTGYRSDAWDQVAAVLLEVMDSDGNIHDFVKNWFCIPLNNNEKDNWWFLGGIPVAVKEWLAQVHKSKELVEIWNKIHRIAMQTAANIWKDRCETNRKKKGLLKDLLEEDMITRMEEEYLDGWNEVAQDLEAAFLEGDFMENQFDWTHPAEPSD